MDEFELSALCNDIALPTAWSVKDKSPLLIVESDMLTVKYIGPNDYKVAAIIRANNPIPLQFGLFYFEVKVINNENNGHIAIGFCAKPENPTKNMVNLSAETDDSSIIPMLGQEDNSWGYHSDDGYSFCSGSGEPYGPSYTTGDIVGCYMNFKENIIFYTKNGINIGIACYLPNNFDDLNVKIYPCVGLRAQDGSVKANFGYKKFEYLIMTNDDMGKELREKYWINLKVLCQYIDELTQIQQINTHSLLRRGKAYLIAGRYEEALIDLNKFLENEPNNTVALRYRGEVYYMMKRYEEALVDLSKFWKLNLMIHGQKK